MVKDKTKGQLQIQNVAKLDPFKIQFSELNSETIQVDISGYGCLNYFDSIDKEIELEININISNQLRDYAEITGHNSADIGYSYTLTPTKKLNRKYNTLEAGVEISLLFKKPVLEASAYQLQPTIELISSIILAEIFIMQ